MKYERSFLYRATRFIFMDGGDFVWWWITIPGLVVCMVIKFFHS